MLYGENEWVGFTTPHTNEERSNEGKNKYGLGGTIVWAIAMEENYGDIVDEESGELEGNEDCLERYSYIGNEDHINEVDDFCKDEIASNIMILKLAILKKEFENINRNELNNVYNKVKDRIEEGVEYQYAEWFPTVSNNYFKCYSGLSEIKCEYINYNDEAFFQAVKDEFNINKEDMEFKRISGVSLCDGEHNPNLNGCYGFVWYNVPIPKKGFYKSPEPQIDDAINGLDEVLSDNSEELSRIEDSEEYEMYIDGLEMEVSLYEELLDDFIELKNKLIELSRQRLGGNKWGKLAKALLKMLRKIGVWMKKPITNMGKIENVEEVKAIYKFKKINITQINYQRRLKNVIEKGRKKDRKRKDVRGKLAS